MADTPKRLVGPAHITNTAATVYTTPGSTLAIVRYLHVLNGDAGAVNFTLSIGTDGASTRLFDAYPIAAGGVLDITEMFIPLAAAEIIQAFGSVTNKLVLTIGGAERA
jgi:hypothetical protein